MTSIMHKPCKTIISLTTVFVCGLLFAGISLAGERNAASLLDQVVSLNLGLNTYYIGHVLTQGQKKKGLSHINQDAYKGTYKFSDKDLFIVVDEKTDRILAIYKRQENVDKNRVKEVVVELMDHFDAPTILAHEKILYWAFNKHGAISEDDFNRAKAVKQVPALGIIATVKFNSEIEITPEAKTDNEKEVTEKDSPTGTLYYVITSDPLVKHFMRKPNS